MEKTASFDQAAITYDDTFTYSEIGKLQRQRVYHWLDKSNFPGKAKTLFELNCGTGHDAEQFHKKGLQIIATDGSPEMIRYAKANRDQHIEFAVLDFNDVNSNTINGEVIFSNFGGLNCLNQTDLESLLNRITAAQKSGEQLALVIMPRYCFMEGLYFFSRFRWGKLFRRNTSEGIAVNVDGKDVMTFYHSPRQVKKMLPQYHIKQIKPVAICLPPSYMESFFKSRPRLLSFLNKLEGTLGSFSFLAGWSDHYILVAEKK